MGCRIIFAPQAIADLEQIVRHIAAANPAAATRIGAALIDRVAVLEKFPLLGADYPKRRGVRKLVASPYIIFYRLRPDEDVVDILRYWHGARNEPSVADL